MEMKQDFELTTEEKLISRINLLLDSEDSINKDRDIIGLRIAPDNADSQSFVRENISISQEGGNYQIALNRKYSAFFVEDRDYTLSFSVDYQGTINSWNLEAKPNNVIVIELENRLSNGYEFLQNELLSSLEKFPLN